MFFWGAGGFVFVHDCTIIAIKTTKESKDNIFNLIIK